MFITDIDVVDNSITTIIIVEIHLIDDLKANILVNVDVLKLQKIILNFEHNIFIINNYNITTTINLINRDKLYIKRIIRNQKTFIVLFNELIKILIIFQDDLSNDKNFLFKFQCFVYLNQNESVYAYIINLNLLFI